MLNHILFNMKLNRNFILCILHNVNFLAVLLQLTCEISLYHNSYLLHPVHGIIIKKTLSI